MLPIALVIVALFALLPASAAADGLPAVGIDANPVSIPGGQVEYQTAKAGQATRLAESARYGGELPRTPDSRRLLDPRRVLRRVAERPLRGWPDARR